MVKVVQRPTPPRSEKKAAAEAAIEHIQSVSQEEATLRLAQAAGLPYIDLSIFPIEREAIFLLPEDAAREHGIVVFEKDKTALRVGILDPDSERARTEAETLATAQGVALALYVVSSSSFDHALAVYEQKPFVEHLDNLRITLSGEDLAAFERDFGALLDISSEKTGTDTSRLLEIIMAGASSLKASDIHIEPEEHGARLRYRIDGLLQDIGHLGSDVYRLLLSRIKMLGKMKLNIRDRAQDGHFFIMEGETRVDIRVSLVPSSAGETITMRLLNSKSAGIDIEDLGLRGAAFEEVKSQIEKPNGMVVNTGPTGSGKTTTLYSLLRTINNPEVKIITLEDPIEYALPGVVQTEVSGSEDYTFSSALRAIVRQDPDVILVGEIRDGETAEVAMNAALTGHLVFTTLHTNDAAASVLRLEELGIERALMANAVNLFIGQRLVRTLCKECKESYAPATSTIAAIEKILKTIPKEAGVPVPKDIPTLYRPTGCAACRWSGYRGRIGIFEVFPMRNRIREKIQDFATISDLRDAARAEGMMTMNQDGVLKVVEGLTTFEEVWRHTDHDEELTGLYRRILSEEHAGEKPTDQTE